MALEWKDRIVEHPKRYQLIPVAGQEDVFDLMPVTGEITEAGTPVNAVNMNEIENSIINNAEGIESLEGDLGDLTADFNAHVGSGGDSHAIASTIENGFMSTSDKEKVDTIPDAIGKFIGSISRTGAGTSDLAIPSAYTQITFALYHTHNSSGDGTNYIRVNGSNLQSFVTNGSSSVNAHFITITLIPSNFIIISRTSVINSSTQQTQVSYHSTSVTSLSSIGISVSSTNKVQGRVYAV
jgi:hypothetical protein